MKRLMSLLFLTLPIICSKTQGEPPASVGANVDEAGNIAALQHQLDDAETAFKNAVIKGEVYRGGDRPNMDAARQSFANAMEIVRTNQLANKSPAVAATALADDAWFKGKVDNDLDGAVSEIKEAVAANESDALLHYKYASLLHDKLINTNPPDPEVLKTARTRVAESIRLDPKIPEAYILSCSLNAGNVPNDTMFQWNQQFLKLKKQLRPELYVYDEKFIKAAETSIQHFVDTYPTTKPVVPKN